MIQIGECYYVPCRDRLYLIEEVEGTHVIATVMMKELNFNGYRIYNKIFYYTNSFIGRIKLDSKVFYKIRKLLELNYRNCRLFLDKATVLDNSNFGYCPESSWITLFYGRISTNVSSENLFMTDNLTHWGKIFIDEATFNKAQTNCLSTISAIDEIWAQFK